MGVTPSAHLHLCLNLLISSWTPGEDRQQNRLWADGHTYVQKVPAQTLEAFTVQIISRLDATADKKWSCDVIRAWQLLPSSLVAPVLPFVEVLTHMSTNRSRRIRFLRLDQGQQLSRDQTGPTADPRLHRGGGGQRRRSHQVCHMLLLQRPPVISNNQVKAPDVGGSVSSRLSPRSNLLPVVFLTK